MMAVGMMAVAGMTMGTGVCRGEVRGDVGPLMKTLWGQGLPYNYELYKYDSYTDVYYNAGSAGVALAQCMRLYEHPATITADLTATFVNLKGVAKEETVSFTDHSMWWSDDEFDACYSVEPCGYAAATVFYPEDLKKQSRGYVAKALGALVSVFDYDADALHLTLRGAVSEADLEDMIYADLAMGRPVVWQGLANEYQTLVVDGYRAKDGLWHLNMCDGTATWAALPDYAEYADYETVPCQAVLTGFTPEGAAATEQSALQMSGLLTATGSLELGDVATFSGFYACNGTTAAMKITPALRLVAGAADEMVTATSKITLAPGGGFGTLRVTLPDDLADGTYTLQLAAIASDGTELEATNTRTTESALLKVEGGSCTYATGVTEPSALQQPTLSQPAAPDTWHTLTGLRLTAAPTAPGLYLHGRRVVAITR